MEQYGGILWWQWLILMGSLIVVIVGCITLGYVMGYAAGGVADHSSSRFNIVDRLIAPRKNMGKRDFDEVGELDALMEGREEDKEVERDDGI